MEYQDEIEKEEQEKFLSERINFLANKLDAKIINTPDGQKARVPKKSKTKAE